MSDFDFQLYLRAIVDRYSQQRDLYTPTDALLLLDARSVEREEESREKQGEQFPVLEGLRKYALGEKREHVLLAGRPGAGKSMVLQQLVVELAAEGLVPVLVQLKGDRTVPELIKAEFRARAKVCVTDEQIEDWLMADRLVLLLDGVNEIPTEELRRKLAQFREDNRSVPMIFTTRDLAIGGDLGITKRLGMKPLSPEQLREFVGKYFPEGGEQLLGQLRDRLREIAETTLLLKMLCDVFKKMGEVPQNKGELFRLFDREYDKFKGMPAVSEEFRRFKSEVLQHLAYVMMHGDGGVDFELTIAHADAEKAIETLLKGRVDAPGAKAKEWLEDLVEHHLLQVAADGRRLEFHHQLFQEYYAAEWLLGRVVGMDDERLDCEFLNLLKWTEAVGLMLGLVEDEGLAVRVMERGLGVDLMLGARLAGMVRSGFQEKTVELTTNQDLPPDVKVICLGKIASSYAISKLLIFVNDFVSVVRWGTRERDKNAEIRWRAINELGNLGSKDAVPCLERALKNENWNIQYRAQDALDKINKTEKSAALNHKLDVNKSSYDITLLIETLDSDDFRTRESAIKQLGEIGSEACIAIPKLLDMLDNDLSIQPRIVVALGQLGCKTIAPNLIRMLGSKDRWVQMGAAVACWYLDDETVIPALLEYLKYGDDGKARSYVANALGKSDGSEQVISGLLNAIDDDYLDVRWSVCQALGNLKNPIVLPRLRYRLHHIGGDEIVKAIATIQTNCKFYNYEIHQKAQTRQLPEKQQNTLDTIATDINEINQRTKIMAEQPSTINLSGTFNGPVNLASNQGHQPTTIIDTQNNYFGTDEALLQQITDLQTFITELESQHPNLQTEDQANTVVQTKLDQLQTQNPDRWQKLRDQMKILKAQFFNPERHAQAAKATIVEITKAKWEESLIVKAIVTYLDKFSETPDKRA